MMTALTSIEQNNEQRSIIYLLWSKKIYIALFTSFFSIASIIYSLTLPNVYKSEASLSPVMDDSASRLSGQLGGLAALAGVNLNGMGGGDKTAVTLEILKSRRFIGDFIDKYNLYVPLMAVKDWDSVNNKLIINEKIYDNKQEKWVRKVEHPFLPKPSNLEAIEEFNKKLTITQDKVTGVVRIAIEHYSPHFAKDWVVLLVNEINKEMRQRDLKESKLAIKYLEEQSNLTNITELRAMLYSLIEEQTKTVMLANIREEYSFKVLDNPIVPEKKSKPSRAIIVIMFTMLGFFFSSGYFILSFFNNELLKK